MLTLRQYSTCGGRTHQWRLSCMPPVRMCMYVHGSLHQFLGDKQVCCRVSTSCATLRECTPKPLLPRAARAARAGCLGLQLLLLRHGMLPHCPRTRCQCSDHWSRERFLRGELLCSWVASHLSPAAEPTSCASCACVDPVRACFARGRCSVLVRSDGVARRFMSLLPWRPPACASLCRSSGVCSSACPCWQRAGMCIGWP